MGADIVDSAADPSGGEEKDLHFARDSGAKWLSLTTDVTRQMRLQGSVTLRFSGQQDFPQPTTRRSETTGMWGKLYLLFPGPYADHYTLQ